MNIASTLLTPWPCRYVSCSHGGPEKKILHGVSSPNVGSGMILSPSQVSSNHASACSPTYSLSHTHTFTLTLSLTLTQTTHKALPLLVNRAGHPRHVHGRRRVPLQSKCGKHKTVKARFRPWSSGKRLRGCPLLGGAICPDVVSRLARTGEQRPCVRTRPDSGLGFRANVVETYQVVACLVGRGTWRTATLRPTSAPSESFLPGLAPSRPLATSPPPDASAIPSVKRMYFSENNVSH